MQLRIDHAQPDDAPIIAQMVGELLREIMAMVETKVFEFHQERTEARARSWMTNGKYSVLLARDRAQPEPLGLLALYESYALYSEGVYGTIPEFYVRQPYRSQGVGAALLMEAKGIGRSKGWTRLEVTTPPLPQFDRTLAFYQQQGFSISGGRKLKVDL
ncbi:MAG TPA: GNAT family N-acetyltransferase [Nitrospiraceae bacterium]|jgi:GNAT superfamily N-acetyltransferase|nr:GNAT family N-acetyltransferase [Nitrospiraceae bacterium]HSV90500.1 GNAT family N-acetyltransferase [Nitrospiraceae bacterium]